MEEELPTVRFYDRDGTEHDEVLRTKSGKIITEADIDDWVAEAIEGYETHEFVLFEGAQTFKPSEGPKCQECGRPKSKHIAQVHWRVEVPFLSVRSNGEVVGQLVEVWREIPGEESIGRTIRASELFKLLEERDADK